MSGSVLCENDQYPIGGSIHYSYERVFLYGFFAGISLKISSGSENNRVCLSVCDNGCGVKPYELRYLFEKGFTGENSQKKSTGMGLYLVRQIGQEIKIEVEAVSVYGKGMEIRLWFPVV